MFSINKFIVDPVEGDGALRSDSSEGFAFIEQRTTLRGLITKIDAHINSGQSHYLVPAGSTIYIKEERMFHPSWPKTIYKTEGSDAGMMIIDSSFVEFIKPSELRNS